MSSTHEHGQGGAEAVAEAGTKKDRRIYILSEARPEKAVISLGLPLVAGMFIMVLYNLTDTFFIGMLRDDYQLAAVNLAYPVMMVMIAVSNMIGTGASSLIARSMGAGDTELAEHTLTAGYLLTVVNSATVAAAGLALRNPIVSLLGARSNTFDYTAEYVTVLLIGSLCTMGNFTFGQLLRSEGSVKYSIAGMVAGTAANIVLDPVFIFGFGWEILGAAVATVIGNGVGMLVSISYYVRKKTLLRPSVRYIRPTSQILKEIFWVGVPATLETLLTTAAYVVNNNLAVAYGELTVAAMGIAQKILSIGNYIYQGFAAGNQPLMGYNYGAENYSRMLQVLRAGVRIVSGIELFVMAVFGIFAPKLIRLFTASDVVIRIGAKVLRALMCVLPFVGATSMSRTTFQSMGKPQYAFGITLVRQFFLYIPLLLLLNRRFGFNGLIWAQPVTEVIMMIVSLMLLRRILLGLERRKM